MTPWTPPGSAIVIAGYRRRYPFTVGRRAFAVHGPMVWNSLPDDLRAPSVVRRVDGMTGIDVEALRRRRREPTSAVKWRVSARYDGAVPIRHRYARTHNRN